MSVKPVPEGAQHLTPYLVIKNAAAAIDFYKKIFGARENFRMEAPGGKVGHAELEIGGSAFMIADEFPGMDCKGPGAYGGSPVRLYLYVNDVDEVVKRAQAAGAKILYPLQTHFYGDRTCLFADPFGHLWNVATHVEDVPEDEVRRRGAQVMERMK